MFTCQAHMTIITTITITTMTTYTTQPQRVGASVALINQVGPCKDTHGTLVPFRRKTVGGAIHAPQGEITHNDGALGRDNRQVLRQTKKESAPGPDGIPYSFLQMCGKVGFAGFSLTHTNMCWRVVLFWRILPKTTGVTLGCPASGFLFVTAFRPHLSLAPTRDHSKEP